MTSSKGDVSSRWSFPMMILGESAWRRVILESCCSPWEIVEVMGVTSSLSEKFELLLHKLTMLLLAKLDKCSDLSEIFLSFFYSGF